MHTLPACTFLHPLPLRGESGISEALLRRLSALSSAKGRGAERGWGEGGKPPHTPNSQNNYNSPTPTTKNHPMKTTTLTAIILLTTACTTQTTHIYKPDGNKQCEPATSTLADSTRQLTNAGIEVHSSHCATQTGMAVITVCGAPTLGIHLHEINSFDLQEALTLGYEDANKLSDQYNGTGYEITACPVPD